MRFDLRLTHRSLDQLYCQALVAFLFEDDSFLKGSLSRLDEKLAGSLTRLIHRHFLTGKRDELILIAPPDRIRADKLLFFGLGPISSYSSQVFSSDISRLASALEKLKLNEFGITVPWAEEIEMDYVELIRSILNNLIEYYLMNKRDAVDFSLKVVFSIEERFFADLQSLQEELRKYFGPIMECSILIDNS